MQQAVVERPKPRGNRLGALGSQLQSQGRYTFSRDEAIHDLGVSLIAFQAAARRLAQKRDDRPSLTWDRSWSVELECVGVLQLSPEIV